MDTLPFEILQMISDHLSYADRAVLHQVMPYMPYPLHEFAEKYLPCDWALFAEQLGRTESVIGGLTALRFFSYVDFQPNDLDIYGQMNSLPSWVHFFRRHGFRENNLQRHMIHYQLLVGRFEFRRGSFVVQYIFNCPADEVDNTANECTVSPTEAICPHYNDVKQKRTVFNVHNADRIAKMIARGYTVRMKPALSSWIERLLSMFREKEKVDYRVRLI